MALDGSRCSKLALGVAMNLAAEQGSHVELIYVVDDSEPLLDVAFINRDDLLRSMASYGRGVLSDAIRLLDKRGIQHGTRLIASPIKRGRIGETLIAEALKWRADLFVMGTHGRRGFRRLFTGSVSQFVVSHSKIPVLLVKSDNDES